MLHVSGSRACQPSVAVITELGIDETENRGLELRGEDAHCVDREVGWSAIVLGVDSERMLVVCG